MNYFTGKVIFVCPDKILIATWYKTGNEASGSGKFDDGTELEFAFSENRTDAVAYFDHLKIKSKKVKVLAQKEEKNLETKDKTDPIIKITYNEKTYSSEIEKKVTIVSTNRNYEISGRIEDTGGSKKNQLRVKYFDGRE